MKLLPSRKKFLSIFICFLTGTLLGLSYPPFRTWFLIYPGIILLLHLILTSERYKQVLSRGYFSLLVFNAITIYWIGSWSSNDTALKLGGAATVIVHPIFMMIPVTIIYFINKSFNKNTAILLFPVLWLGFEYLHNTWQLSFPWLDLGNSESYNINRIQYIELVGVHGISFIICIISSLLYYTTTKISNNNWKLSSGKTLLNLIIILLLIIGPNLYSHFIVLSENNADYYKTVDKTKEIRSSIIQTNVDAHKKWAGGIDSLMDSYIEKMNTSLKSNPDLVVLHETATPYYFFEDYYYMNTKKFLDFANNNKKYVLIGIPHLGYYPDSVIPPSDCRITKTGKKYDTWNSAVLIEPDKPKDLYTIHKKVKLVPFSERVPYKEYLPFLQKFVVWSVGIGNWQLGDSLVIFNLNNDSLKPKAKFATLICYESVFSDFVRYSVKKGAEFLIVITNDGWWGESSGPYQHNQYAVLRAIENRKWIIRAAQTGVSCYIDPLGNIYEDTKYNTEAVINKTIVANGIKTYYSEHGDIIGRVSFYLTILTIVLCPINYVYNKKRRSIA